MEKIVRVILIVTLLTLLINDSFQAKTVQAASEVKSSNADTDVKDGLSVVESLATDDSNSNTQLSVTLLEQMLHELVQLRVTAYESGNVKLAKEIRQSENELQIQFDEQSIQNNKATEEIIQQYKDLVDEYYKKIISFRKVLSDTPTVSSRMLLALNGSLSQSIIKAGDGQTILIGEKALVSLKSEAIKDSVDVHVIDSNNNIVVSDRIENATDTPTYTWSTSNVTLPGLYNIVFHYPETNTDDTFAVYVNPTPEPVVIEENKPLDAQLDLGSINVYKFKPTKSQVYRISTAGYEGEQSTSDTWLGLYSDETLSTLIQSNGDKNDLDSEVMADLKSDTTYYIVLKGEGNSDGLETQMSVMSYDYFYIGLNNPVDVKGLFTENRLFQFCAPAAGSYAVTTSYYQNTPTQYESDTILWLYNDLLLQQQLGYGDDYYFEDGTYTSFSQIKWDMSANSCNYILLGGYTDEARITVTQQSGLDYLVESSPKDISLKEREVGHYKFTPTQSGNYTISTGPYNWVGAPYDYNALTLFDDVKFEHQVAYSDHYSDPLHNIYTQYSRITYPMTAGKTYYISLEQLDGVPLLTRVSIQKDLVVQDIYEPNNFLSSGFPSSVNKSYSAFISSATDKDYYTITSVADGASKVIVTMPSNNNYNFIIYDPDSWGTELLRGGTPKSGVVEGVFQAKKNKKYIVQIYSVDGSYSIDNNYSLILSQNDELTPSAPTNLVTSDSSSSSVTLSWEEIGNPVALTSYEIYNDTKYTGSVDGSKTSYQITGLAPNIIYHFTVKAISTKYNSAISKPLVFILGGTTLNYNYENGRLKTITIKATGQVFKTYKYDNNGNLIEIISS